MRPATPAAASRCPKFAFAEPRKQVLPSARGAPRREIARWLVRCGADLRCGADERGDLEPVLGGERVTDAAFVLRTRPGRVEHDVATVDVGPHLLVAQLLEDLDDPRHRDGALADVDGTEERDTSGHADIMAARRPGDRWRRFTRSGGLP